LNTSDNEFLIKVTESIEQHLDNEQFGVSELAREMGMSRSNLLRKLKKLSGKSVSQFIRELRLNNAMEMLVQESWSVSEVSYKVGFSSVSYFIKCFHDLYGFPPGEVGKTPFKSGTSDQPDGTRELQENKPAKGNFWQELKRRKVVKVIVVYATISFILLQLISILIEPLYLPDWSMTLVIVLLAIGFPIAIVFSWIFDITPDGIEVTQSIDTPTKESKKGFIRQNQVLVGSVTTALIMVLLFYAYPSLFQNGSQTEVNPELEKSIAVLPFKNDSNDSTNVYVINGLMESILLNLQQIKDLRVISRTSVEKYRNSNMTIPEIAKELNVNYFVEGSGQKIGDKLLLNVQLIEAESDNHLLSEQYSKESKDIFELQMEVAKNIAEKIQVAMTPEEEALITKIPTDNPIAYDYYLQARFQMQKHSGEGLMNAIPYLEKAIENDEEFSLPYAALAMTYYYLDLFAPEKQYTEKIKDYADSAMSLDSEIPLSLIAKALSYMQNYEYDKAVSHFENALKRNPNSSITINFLADFYTRIRPDTHKYLEYALKASRLDMSVQDSYNIGFNYLHIANAFIQTGFINQAEEYINKSLDYYPDNIYAHYVKAYILYAKNRDIERSKRDLLLVLEMDTTRLDVLQEVGKIHYYAGDFEKSYHYYKKFIDIKEDQNLTLFDSESAKIGVVFDKMGQTERANTFFSAFKTYADQDSSMYKDLSLAVYHAYKKNKEKALEHLELFSEQRHYFYWTIIFLKIDPLVDSIKDLPEFHRIMQKLEDNFWNDHLEFKASLEAMNLI
jgi:TolB-like protein/AraC-like DNA-binding protein/Tfp pilus assembly protein PilF